MFIRIDKVTIINQYCSLGSQGLFILLCNEFKILLFLIHSLTYFSSFIESSPQSLVGAVFCLLLNKYLLLFLSFPASEQTGSRQSPVLTALYCFQDKLLQAKKEVEKYSINTKQVCALSYLTFSEPSRTVVEREKVLLHCEQVIESITEFS